MRILIIDNYCSFTWNLYHLVALNCDSPPLIVQNDDYSASQLFEFKPDGIIISSGPGRVDNKADFGVCDEMISSSSVPILGVCLGHQGIGVHYGLPLIKAPEPIHGQVNKVYHDGSKIFAGIPSSFNAVRYHSLILPSEMTSVKVDKIAWTADGLTMGVSVADRPIWGVQFHPESICTDIGDALIRNFINICHQNAVNKDGKTIELAKASANKMSDSKIEFLNDAIDLHLYCEKLDDWLNPEIVFETLFGDKEYSYWLDSSALIGDENCFSFMGDNSGDLSHVLLYDVSIRALVINSNQREILNDVDLFDYMDRQLDKYNILNKSSLPFEFYGGYVSYFGYEMKELCGYENGKQSKHPDFASIFSDRFIAFDHKREEMWLVYLSREGDRAKATQWYDAIKSKLKHTKVNINKQVVKSGDPITFHSEIDKNKYISCINRAKQYIEEGESYEVCLTTRFEAEVNVDGLSVYKELREINPAPYSSYLKFGEYSILSSSPERFVKSDPYGHVETKPIKGTISRGRNQREDEQQKSALRLSVKDMAENLMIVDLLRNDLSKISTVGSVNVDNLMEIETFATVHQMVTTISSRLKKDLKISDFMKSLFPGGSMTGAPKKRTLQIIDELEISARGIYSGCIGYFSLSGSIDLGIVIRTIVSDANGVSIGAGGAITALSNPGAEYDEVVLKAMAPMQAVAKSMTGMKNKYIVV